MYEIFRKILNCKTWFGGTYLKSYLSEVKMFYKKMCVDLSSKFFDVTRAVNKIVPKNLCLPNSIWGSKSLACGVTTCGIIRKIVVLRQIMLEMSKNV